MPGNITPLSRRTTGSSSGIAGPPMLSSLIACSVNSIATLTSHVSSLIASSSLLFGDYEDRARVLPTTPISRSARCSPAASPSARSGRRTRGTRGRVRLRPSDPRPRKLDRAHELPAIDLHLRSAAAHLPQIPRGRRSSADHCFVERETDLLRAHPAISPAPRSRPRSGRCRRGWSPAPSARSAYLLPRTRIVLVTKLTNSLRLANSWLLLPLRS